MRILKLDRLHQKCLSLLFTESPELKNSKSKNLMSIYPHPQPCQLLNLILVNQANPSGCLSILVYNMKQIRI